MLLIETERAQKVLRAWHQLIADDSLKFFSRSMLQEAAGKACGEEGPLDQDKFELLLDALAFAGLIKPEIDGHFILVRNPQRVLGFAELNQRWVLDHPDTTAVISVLPVAQQRGDSLTFEEVFSRVRRTDSPITKARVEIALQRLLFAGNALNQEWADWGWSRGWRKCADYGQQSGLAAMNLEKALRLVPKC